MGSVLAGQPVSQSADQLVFVVRCFVATGERRRDADKLRAVYKDHNLHVLFGVTLMAVLGVSSITPALPEIRQAFGVTTGQVGLLITAFTLPGIALTPVLGALSDRHGRKKILAPALLLFGLAGGLCVFARSFELLLALRFLQGMGASALGTLNVTVNRRPLEEHSHYNERDKGDAIELHERFGQCLMKSLVARELERSMVGTRGSSCRTRRKKS